jgi:hypothetical protein
MSILTKEEALEKYRIYLQAEEAIAVHGQSYEMDDGIKLTRANLAEIRNGLNYWEKKVNDLSGEIRVFTAIPRDL